MWQREWTNGKLLFLRVCLAPKQSVKTDVIRQIMERMGVGKSITKVTWGNRPQFTDFSFNYKARRERFSQSQNIPPKGGRKKLFKPNRKKMFLNPLSLFYHAFASSAYFSAPSTRWGSFSSRPSIISKPTSGKHFFFANWITNAQWRP